MIIKHTISPMDTEIVETQVLRETAQFVWLPSGDGERREAKIGKLIRHYDSRDEAGQQLMTWQIRKIQRLEAQLAQARADLVKMATTP